MDGAESGDERRIWGQALQSQKMPITLQEPPEPPHQERGVVGGGGSEAPRTAGHHGQPLGHDCSRTPRKVLDPPVRTDNSVKNRFYSKMRKAIRDLNVLGRRLFEKKHKDITISFIFKLSKLVDGQHKEGSETCDEIIQTAEGTSAPIRPPEINHSI